jgi:hypothetical protein
LIKTKALRSFLFWVGVAVENFFWCLTIVNQLVRVFYDENDLEREVDTKTCVFPFYSTRIFNFNSFKLGDIIAQHFPPFLFIHDKKSFLIAKSFQKISPQI